MNRVNARWAILLLSIAPPLHATPAMDASGAFEIGRYGHILVPVSIDGGPPRTFAVDTAASHVVLDQTTFRDLMPAESAAAGDAARAAHGAHGTLAAALTRLDSVMLWQRESKDLDAVLLPVAGLGHRGPPDFDGVLGIPYLSRFLVDIDFETRRLALYDRADASSCRLCPPQEAVALDTLVGGLKAIRVTLDGVPLRALLDTGAARSVLNPAAAERLPDWGTGTGQPSPATITIGRRVVVQTPRPEALDLPVFGTLGLADKPAMILGLDILGSGRLVLDLAGSTAWFMPHPPVDGA